MEKNLMNTYQGLSEDELACLESYYEEREWMDALDQEREILEIMEEEAYWDDFACTSRRYVKESARIWDAMEHGYDLEELYGDGRE